MIAYDKEMIKAEELNRRGIEYHQLGDYKNAVAAFMQALEDYPDDAGLLSNLASSYYELGQLRKAESLCKLAINYSPEHANAHFNLGRVMLLNGNYKEGLAEYEWRWRERDKTDFSDLYQDSNDFYNKRWQGQNLTGKRLLLSAEQGLGDTIQFIRYAKEAKKRGGDVYVLCQPAIGRLLCSAEGIDMLIPAGAPLPEFDYFAPLLSLPFIFETTPENAELDIPYLYAEDELIAKWQDKISSLKRGKKLAVGLMWQGKLDVDAQRSMPLSALSKLKEFNDDIAFISLQKDISQNEINTKGDGFKVTSFADELDAGADAFIDTAAVMKNLDLVITIDTSTAHLAGALGVNTYLMLKYTPEWRWMKPNKGSKFYESTFWYPDIKIFRQESIGIWDKVVHDVYLHLRNLL